MAFHWNPDAGPSVSIFAFVVATVEIEFACESGAIYNWSLGRKQQQKCEIAHLHLSRDHLIGDLAVGPCLAPSPKHAFVFGTRPRELRSTLSQYQRIAG